MIKNPYIPFKGFLLRTPSLPVERMLEITTSTEITNTDLKTICDDSFFLEAIYLASQSLYKQIIKWKSKGINDKLREEKLKYSVLKYYLRMTTRCTPYGLFAGCALGKIEDETDFKVKNNTDSSAIRNTRIDMDVLESIVQTLLRIPKIRNQLKYHPNSSLYKAGPNLRFIEQHYINGKRSYQLSEVKDTFYLKKILKKSKKGTTLTDLCSLLVGDEIDNEEAVFFLNELVKSQILVSQLELSVSGEDNFKEIYTIIKNLKSPKVNIQFLDSLNKCISKIGQNSKRNIAEYKYLRKILNDINIDTNDKPIIQTDLKINCQHLSLDKSIVDSVRKGLSVLNKLSVNSGSKRLDEFKSVFYDRYQDQEVPLALVMDVEMGIGYRQNQGSGVICPLIDDIKLPHFDMSVKTFELSDVHTFFYQKLLKAVKNKDYIISLKDEDLDDFEIIWDDLPDTVSLMIELLKIKEQTKIKMSGIQGSSAVNLLARFSYLDSNISHYVKEIVAYEQNFYSDKIMAEIVHIPESRTGNILLRPVLRPFEIPYLANSTLKVQNQININDINVSLRGNEIILKSKKFKKEVVPRLSNAHNYMGSKLPIYQFLCDLQTQNKREKLFLDLGPLVNGFDFIPRIEYSNVILRYASWNIKRQEILELSNNKNDIKELKSRIKNFRKKRNIPKLVLLVEGDNELPINLENITCLRMFFDLVKNKNNIVLREFLFDTKNEVSDLLGKSSYTNQIVLSFKKCHKDS